MLFLFFFFKQKTAYEMRISDWSSDVCSSDLEDTKNVDAFSCWRNGQPFVFLNTFKSAERSRFDAAHELAHLVLHRHGGPQGREIGRASCRERVCQYV